MHNPSFNEWYALAKEEIAALASSDRPGRFEGLLDILEGLRASARIEKIEAVKAAEERTHRMYFQHPEDRPGI